MVLVERIWPSASNCLVAALAGVAVTSPALAAAPPPQAPAVSMPPEIAAHVPADLRSYYLVLKVNPPTPKPMSSELFERHQAYLRQQIEQKVIHLVGPLTDGGRIRGISILTAASLEEARRIAEGDPAVQEQVLAVEVHPAVFPNLSSLEIGYPPKPKP